MSNPPANSGKQQPTDPWQEVGWESHESAQLKRMAKIPFSRKLEILEEMQRRFLQMHPAAPGSTSIRPK